MFISFLELPNQQSVARSDRVIVLLCSSENLFLSYTFVFVEKKMECQCWWVTFAVGNRLF